MASNSSISPPPAVNNSLPPTLFSYRWVISDAASLLLEEFAIEDVTLASPTFTALLPFKGVKTSWNLIAMPVLYIGVGLRVHCGHQSNIAWDMDTYIPSFFVKECKISIIHPKTDEVLYADEIAPRWVTMDKKTVSENWFTDSTEIKDPQRMIIDNTLTLQVNGEILCFPHPDEQDNSHKVVVPLDNIRAELYSLFEESAYTDVTIKCGGEEFKAHKAVLASQSPVFKTMFEVDMKEKDSNIIEISDIDSTVISDLMAYFYKGKPLYLNTMAKDLLNAANKYELPRLFAMCENELVKDLNVENIVEILVLADMHGAKNLKEKCARYYQQNASRVKTTSGWKHLKDNMDKYSALLMELLEFTD